MVDHPTLEEIQKTIKRVNNLEAPGFGEIPVEDLFHGGNNLAVEIHHMISDVCSEVSLLQDWVDAIIISFFKEKGSK